MFWLQLAPTLISNPVANITIFSACYVYILATIYIRTVWESETLSISLFYINEPYIYIPRHKINVNVCKQKKHRHWLDLCFKEQSLMFSKVEIQEGLKFENLNTLGKPLHTEDPHVY